MKEKEFFNEKVQEGASIRVELSEILWKAMNQAKIVFNSLVPFKNFSNVKTFLYYKGGYPKPDSPPKINEHIKKLAHYYWIVKFLDFKEEYEKIHEVFQNFGLQITEIEPIVPLSSIDDKKQEKKVKRALLKLGFEENEIENLLLDKKELLRKILQIALELQCEICEKSDKIKIDLADEVKETCEVPKSTFLKAVDLQAKKIKLDQEKYKELIKKIKEKIEIEREIIEDLEE